jgi:hypothetical protein
MAKRMKSSNRLGKKDTIIKKDGKKYLQFRAPDGTLRLKPI